MTTVDFVQDHQLFGSQYEHLQIGVGVEAEIVQRAAKAQIMRNLPFFTEKLQDIWDERDRAYAAAVGGSFQRLILPTVEKENFYTGIKPSFVEASLELWPAVIAHSKDAKPYEVQEDQFDTFSIPLYIEVMCKAGPVELTEIHERRGIEVEQELDSQVQRLTDAVHLCIRKDPSLGSVIFGEIEKPPNIIQSLPWSRPEEKTANTNHMWIFQGKQLEYIVQKNSY